MPSASTWKWPCGSFSRDFPPTVMSRIWKVHAGASMEFRLGPIPLSLFLTSQVPHFYRYITLGTNPFNSPLFAPEHQATPAILGILNPRMFNSVELECLQKLSFIFSIMESLSRMTEFIVPSWLEFIMFSLIVKSSRLFISIIHLSWDKNLDKVTRHTLIFKIILKLGKKGTKPPTSKP